MAFRLHPARLVPAVTGAGAAAIGSVAVAAIAPRLGVAAGPLAGVLGGLVTFNVLLLFPAGALAPHLRRFPIVLAATMLPLPASVLAHRAGLPVADLLLVLVAGAAVLGRSAGPLAAGTTLNVLINVLIPLVLGSPWAFVTVGPLAGVVGTTIGFAADGVTLFLLARVAVPPERWLLAMAAAERLDLLGGQWSARPHVGGKAHRFAVAAADLAMAAPGRFDTLTPHHLMESIGRDLSRLQAMRGTLPPSLDAAIGRALPDAAAQFRAGSLGGVEAVAHSLRAAVTAVRSTPAQAESTARALILALLLARLATVTLGSSAAAPAALAAPLRVSRVQLRLALQAMICVGLATIASHTLPTSRPYWIPLTAAIVTCASHGETVRKGYERVLGTAGGLIAGQLAWLLLYRVPDLVSPVLLLGIAGVFFARAAAYRWMLFWVTLVLSLLLLQGGFGSLLYGGRLLDTLIGVAVTLLITRWVLPVHAADTGRAATTAFLRAVGEWLRGAATSLAPAPEPGLRDSQSLAGPLASLSTMHALADAEVLEAWPDRSAAPRVASRLAAADRIARALLMLDPLLALCAPAAPSLRRALLTAAAATDAGSSPDCLVSAPPVQEESSPQSVGAERFVAELRAAALLSAICEAIGIVRANR